MSKETPTNGKGTLRPLRWTYDQRRAELSPDKRVVSTGCSYYKSRGSPICKISLLVEQELLDQTVLKAIEETLTEEMLKSAIEKALAKHRAGASVQLDHRSRIERELSLIEAQLKNLVDAVANGRKDGALFERPANDEARKRSLIEELERLTRPGQTAHLDEAHLKREPKARLADTRALLGRHITSARRLLQALKEHPLRIETTQNGDRKGYRVTGTGNYLPLLSESGRSVVIGVPNGNNQTTEHFLSFSIDLLVEAA